MLTVTVLQTRTTLLTFKVMVISTGCLWLLYTKSCWSFATTWLGAALHHCCMALVELPVAVPHVLSTRVSLEEVPEA